MRKTILILFIIMALIPSIGSVTAQENSFTLRGFASRNGIYMGAAAWTHHLDDPAHREILAREFNMLTPEHEAKFCMISDARGEYDFSRVDELIEFAEENNMDIHGHTLIWHSCSPDWVENADFSREEAIEVLREHITTVVERYKGRILYWDVVNEAFDGAQLRDTAWLRMIGEDYIELAFQFAHEADPDAILLYNDYGAETMNAKSDAVYAMAQDFLARDIPIHGIGMQSHFDLPRINVSSVAENMARLAEIGLEVQLTEVDIKYLGETTDEILRQQAREYYRLMETCLDAVNCTAFIVWGVSDRYTWLRETPSVLDNPTVQPLLFNDDYAPKPAYFALMDLMARRVGATSILPDDRIDEILNGPQTEAATPDVVFSSPDQLAPDSVPGTIYYAPVGVDITLDGDLSDWEGVPRVTVDSGTQIPDGNDTSFEFAVAADDTNLYYMANVTDSNLVYGEFGVGEWYREDSVEFYLNTTGDLGAAAYEPGIVQVGMLAENVTGPEEPLFGGGNSGDAQVSISAVETDTGYIIEASVPLQTDVWDIQPEHMGVIGFQTHLNGSSGDDRDTKLIWSAADTQDQSWSDPSLFGQLVFWNDAPTTSFSSPDQLAPDSDPGVAYYAPVGVSITLDGDLSDWENVPRVTVDSGTQIPDGNDTSFEFAVAADDTHLYYMANVTDSNLVWQYGVGEWYREDSVEFYLNTTGDLGAEAYESGIVQIGILAENVTGPESALVGGGGSGDAQVSVAAVETDTGYIIEASVPLQTDVWDIQLEHMGVIGFQTHLNGSSGDDRDTKLIWSAADTQDQSWSDPSLFGQLVFWNPPE